MAKKKSRKTSGAKSQASARQKSKMQDALARASLRTEDRSSTAPRGTVSTKPVGRVRTFFREVRVEMKKVTWPPRKELIKSTGVVIVAVVIAAVFIGVFDYIWNTVIKAVGLGG